MTGDVEVALLDVADLASVRAFAADVGPVDVLVNNAGVLGVPFGLSTDGVELHLATNHLGHFALTNLLLPRLTDRVVVVGSVSHRSGDVDVNDLLWERRRYVPFAAYGASKLANLLFLAELPASADRCRLDPAGRPARTPGRRPPTSPAAPATGSRPGSGTSATGWWAWRPGGRAADPVRRHDGRARQQLPRAGRAARDDRVDDRGRAQRGARPGPRQGAVGRVRAAQRGDLPARSGYSATTVSISTGVFGRAVPNPGSVPSSATFSINSTVASSTLPKTV